MSIQPKKPAIRKAPKPGPRARETSRPEQPRDARGKPVERRATYEELDAFHDHARAKLREYRTVHQHVLRLIAAGEVERAQKVLAGFVHDLPELGKHPPPTKDTNA